MPNPSPVFLYKGLEFSNACAVCTTHQPRILFATIHMLPPILRDGLRCRRNSTPTRSHLCCALFLFFGSFLHALAGTTNLNWRWSNPQPFGNNITALAYGGTNTAYVAACDRGQLYSSTDLVSWQSQYTGTRRALRAALYVGTNLVVAGESGTILFGPSPDSLTLQDLGTVDWLEGLAASPTQILAVGDNGAVYTSPNGTSWTRRNPGFTTWLRGVTYSTTSGFFIAVGEAGFIATSPDGINWTKRTSNTTANLNRVLWTGLAFIAVGEGGVALYSSNGTSNWRASSTGITEDLNATALDDLQETAAVGAGAVIIDGTLGTGRLWKNELNPNRVAPPPTATYYSALWDGSQFVLGGRAGLLVQGTRQLFSYNWTSYASPTRSWLWDVTSATATGTNISASLLNDSIVLRTNLTTNTFYSAVGQGPVLLQSDNGREWITALAPANATDVVYLGVAARQDLLVAVGSGGAIAVSRAEYQASVSTNSFTNGAIVKSVVLTNFINTAGLAWGASTSKVTVDLQGICTTDSLHIATGANGTILTSPDAITWTSRTSPRKTFLSSVEGSPTGFVAAGDLGTLLFSTDGITWQDRSPGTTNWIYRARWRGNQWIALGQNGALYTSPDGITWTSRITSVTAWLNDVTHVEGTYYAVGTQGTVLTSPDAITWSPADSITGKTLYGTATANGQLVTVGAEGVILRALVGTPEKSVEFLKFPKSSEEDLFLFSGSTDQVFRLDRSTDLIDWTTGPLLEITDTQGILLFLSSETNNPVQQFFRATPIQ